MEQTKAQPTRTDRLNRIKQSFSSRVRDLLDERGMTQKEVCRRTGMKPYELNKYLTMTIAPKPDRVDLVARALGVHADDLVPGYLQPKGKAFNADFKVLGNGRVWIELEGSYDQFTALRIMDILSHANLNDRMPPAHEVKETSNGPA